MTLKMTKEKKCKDCWKPRGHTMMFSRCKQCQYKFVNNKPKKIYELKKTPVKAFWRKRTERISEKWSEYKCYVEIRTTQEHKCQNCWKHIKFFHSSCFAHILSKRDYPDFRYMIENIALVHWIFETKDDSGLTYQCHQEIDTKLAWKKADIEKKLQKKLDKQKQIW